MPSWERKDGKLILVTDDGKKYQALGGGLGGYVPYEEQKVAEAPPDQSAALKATFEKQKALASDYAKGLKSKSDELYGTYQEGARASLPQLINQSRESFAGRGLLRSGYSKKAEAGVVSDINTRLAEKRAEINQNLNQNLNQLEGSVMNTAGLLAAPGADTTSLYGEKMQADLAAEIARAQGDAAMVSGFLGGAGQITGSALGSSWGSSRQQQPKQQWGPWASGYGWGTGR